jgi:peptide/nickel transport system permease protein
MTIDVVAVESGAARAADGSGGPRGELLRQMLRSKAFLAGAFILLVWIVCAIFGHLLAPHDPAAEALTSINRPPSGAHLFGTDQLGRDMLSRVITGARDILVIAPLSVILSTLIGTTLGLAMGYFRGFVDEAISRFLEAFLAIPLIVIGILFVTALGRGNGTLILVIAMVFTPLIARTVRSSVLLERELDYVAAARLRGEGPLYTMFVEILPNIVSPILVEFTVRLGYAVFAIATLSFLGFGVQPPSPDWGLDIASNFGLVSAGYWWEVLFDALALASLVVGVNLITDAVEGVLDQ